MVSSSPKPSSDGHLGRLSRDDTFQAGTGRGLVFWDRLDAKGLASSVSRRGGNGLLLPGGNSDSPSWAPRIAEAAVLKVIPRLPYLHVPEGDLAVSGSLEASPGC